MKIFFDTNVYIAEALVGATAERLVEVTFAARWRIYACDHLIEEVQQGCFRVLT